MDKSFWLDCWDNKTIGFHEQKPNALLVSHFRYIKKNMHIQSIFLPLCGKTNDISWLKKQSFNIIGCELSEIAVRELFDELHITPKITTLASHKCYEANNIKIYVGDFFLLTPELLGKIDLIYDRAALIALPEQTRTDYAQKLTYLTNNACQLLIVFEYPNNLIKGPPFSVSEVEISRLYSENYSFKIRETILSSTFNNPIKSTRETLYFLNKKKVST